MTYREKITAAGRTFVFERPVSPVQVEKAQADAGGLQKVNLKDNALMPSNRDSAEGTPLPLFGAPGVRIDLSKRTTAAMNFWHRNGDGDEVIICLEGEEHWETELGNVTLRSGELLIIPRGVAHRSLPGTPPPSGENLIIELKITNPLSKLY